MIHSSNLSADVVARLSADFIGDKQPLITSAGFSPDSKYAGQPRQTFTLKLTAETIRLIQIQMQGLYDELIRDCWPSDEPIPFDMIRFDAFLEPETNNVKIIELNTRNVGLHEVVEWLDSQVATELGLSPDHSLNQQFVANQKCLHDSRFDTDEPLLYMSPSFLPRWTYFEELNRSYSKVTAITGPEQATYSAEGVMAEGYRYRAITKKLAWPASDALKELDLIGDVRILQPRWMRPYGLKNYLQQLSSPTIIRTETYTAEHAERYAADQANLVLKIIDGGNSKSVFIGGMYTSDQWEKKLGLADTTPEKWIIQDYNQPPIWPVIAHGIGERNLPVQLGIFLLPKPEDPTQFHMDITVKAFAGPDQHFTFDPSGLNPDIWFGHVLVT